MITTKWFRIPIEAQECGGLVLRLSTTGFVLREDGEEGEYTDVQGRMVRVRDGEVHVGIPASDTVSEQEQLEFLLGVLGLNEDDVCRV